MSLILSCRFPQPCSSFLLHCYILSSLVWQILLFFSIFCYHHSKLSSCPKTYLFNIRIIILITILISSTILIFRVESIIRPPSTMLLLVFQFDSISNNNNAPVKVGGGPGGGTSPKNW